MNLHKRKLENNGNLHLICSLLKKKTQQKVQEIKRMELHQRDVRVNNMSY